jgi:hypothetical protein
MDDDILSDSPTAGRTQSVQTMPALVPPVPPSYAAEVHAAAILAAKDMLLNRPEFPQLESDTAALTIGMHAAIIARSYQEFLAAPDLLPPPLQGR